LSFVRSLRDELGAGDAAREAPEDAAMPVVQKEDRREAAWPAAGLL
jgi:hypothetical protein